RSMRRSTRCSRIGRRQPRILAGPPEHALSSAASPTRWVLSEREFRRRTGSLQPLSVLWQPMPRKDTTMKLLHSVAIALTTWAGAAFAQVPAGYPGDYAKVVEAARKEGKVVVYSVLGNKAAAPLVAGFNALYPEIDVEYDGDSGSNEMTGRFIDEVKHNQPSADVMWSSAMDLQMMLVRDGHAAHYASPEAEHLPAWARWRDQAWGTTFEPVVFVYNKKLVAESEVPRDRAAL